MLGRNPGNAILLNGGMQTARRGGEIGAPGFPPQIPKSTSEFRLITAVAVAVAVVAVGLAAVVVAAVVARRSQVPGRVALQEKTVVGQFAAASSG
jgi:hypothetical protein